MKSFSTKVLVLLSLATLFTLGLDWILESSLTMQGALHLNWEGMRSIDNPLFVWGIGGAAMLLPLLTVAVWGLFGRDDSIVARTRDGGTIRLKPGAIERVIRREVGANIEDVVTVRATANQGKRRAPAVKVTVEVSDRVSVPEVDDQVRQETLRVLNQLLGVADSTQIKVIVANIKGVGKSAAPRPVRKAPRPKNGGKKRLPTEIAKKGSAESADVAG